jgi:phospholipase/carboxylesterase
VNAAFVLHPGNPALEPRRGDPPLTTRPSRQQPFPHQQLTQTAPIGLQEELFARVLTLPGVSTGDSCVSVPGARAFILDPALAAGPPAAFQCETEFAHLHPPGDGSLHIALPPDVYRAAQAAGWGDPHPISGTMLVFGPRHRRELEIVWQVVLASYRFALGDWPDTAPATPTADASRDVAE